MKSHQNRWAAAIVAVIVILAEIVIVYELQLAGSWLVPGWLSSLKTVAFILLFVGSLIGEVQPLAPRVRWLLFAAVVILSAYQAVINAWVNFYGADIPQAALVFFADWFTPAQIAWWFAVVDGMVRTVVVVIMWLVTGLVWRGVAVREDDGNAAQADVEALRASLAAAQVAAQGAGSWQLLSPTAKARWLASNTNGDRPAAALVAEAEGVATSTVSREYKRKGE